ncbi:MAG: hypothetical protein RLO81_09790, partial [Fulvivirga sp.]|uniref:hypothetical protein n=1 Tax=Fulvivirga sp. TaxID=1931237 RepID=UPI0032EF1CBC
MVDVEISNLIDRLYDIISGRKGEPRKWWLFDEISHPQNRMCVITKKDRGVNNIEFLSNSEFIEHYITSFDDPAPDFYEYQVDFEMVKCGSVIHVLSTYESKYKPEDDKPFKKGVNSIQIMF